jgi:putative sigma-54 modulation protein
MQLHFTGHHIEITPALRSFTEEKFERLKRYMDRITNIHVTFEVAKLRQIAEASIHLHGGEIHAKSESEDMYSAIDLLIDKLDRQLKKRKEKEGDRR